MVVVAGGLAVSIRRAWRHPPPATLSSYNGMLVVILTLAAVSGIRPRAQPVPTAAELQHQINESIANKDGTLQFCVDCVRFLFCFMYALYSTLSRLCMLMPKLTICVHLTSGWCGWRVCSFRRAPCRGLLLHEHLSGCGRS